MPADTTMRIHHTFICTIPRNTYRPRSRTRMRQNLTYQAVNITPTILFFKLQTRRRIQTTPFRPNLTTLMLNPIRILTDPTLSAYLLYINQFVSINFSRDHRLLRDRCHKIRDTIRPPRQRVLQRQHRKPPVNTKILNHGFTQSLLTINARQLDPRRFCLKLEINDCTDKNSTRYTCSINNLANVNGNLRTEPIRFQRIHDINSTMLNKKVTGIIRREPAIVIRQRQNNI